MFKRALSALCAVSLSLSTPALAGADSRTAWDFEFTSIDGKPLPLAEYKGKVLLVVNTASRCGFTRQYAGLQTLWDTYRDQGLVVLGVPSDAFNQELSSAAAVKDFCETNFGLTFPMTDITPVTGTDAHPFYGWLRTQGHGAPRWNFFKFLVGRDGVTVTRFSNMTGPDSGSLKKAIEQALTAPNG
jgi:glutathione peroxidase